MCERERFKTGKETNQRNSNEREKETERRWERDKSTRSKIKKEKTQFKANWGTEFVTSEKNDQI